MQQYKPKITKPNNERKNKEAIKKTMLKMEQELEKPEVMAVFKRLKVK